MERRNGDYSRRSIRGGRITLELARKVPLRLGKRNAHGIAPGLDGRSGFGLAGLVSRLPSRRRRRYHRRPIFYRWHEDRKSTRLNSSHLVISYAVFCLKKKNKNT